MKALKRRLKGIFQLGAFSAIGIAMTWSIALGQATPDNPVIAVPEPGSLALLATGIGILAAARYRRRK